MLVMSRSMLKLFFLLISICILLNGAFCIQIRKNESLLQAEPANPNARSIKGDEAIEIEVFAPGLNKSHASRVDDEHPSALLKSLKHKKLDSGLIQDGPQKFFIRTVRQVDDGETGLPVAEDSKDETRAQGGVDDNSAAEGVDEREEVDDPAEGTNEEEPQDGVEETAEENENGEVVEENEIDENDETGDEDRTEVDPADEAESEIDTEDGVESEIDTENGVESEIDTENGAESEADTENGAESEADIEDGEDVDGEEPEGIDDVVQHRSMIIILSVIAFVCVFGTVAWGFFFFWNKKKPSKLNLKYRAIDDDADNQLLQQNAEALDMVDATDQLTGAREQTLERV